MSGMNRRTFIGRISATAAALATAGPATAASASAVARDASTPANAARHKSPMRAGLYEFVFARLRYDSGDWDYNPKVCANVLDAVVQYTSIPVYQQEVVITADSNELNAYPFLFMTGHKLVRFNERERRGLVRFVENGGLLFSDDCNHDIDGLYATSFEAEMLKAFGPAGAMPKLPNSHALYRSFFKFPDGPPQTSHELNGWGDDLVHDYLRGIEYRDRLGVLYSNKDYGCEWDYDWRNKRFRARDNTRFAVNIVVYCMT